MATVQTPPTQRLVLYGVDWRDYTRMLRAFANRRAVRLTYDRGVLEIMVLTHEHESDNHILGRFVITLTEECGLPVKGGGSTTMRRRRRQRGLEPDECYWIANEHLVRGKKKIDLRRDPPPDLALEIDVTHSSLDRLAIYAALNVPEVWQLEGQTIVCYLLGSDGRYTASNQSKAFPGLNPADLIPFLALRGQMDENAVVREFRNWVRQRFAAGGSSQPSP
jgi:Uma2 family endonuclease